MKSLFKSLIAITLATGSIAVASSAQACWNCHRGYYNNGYYHHYNRPHYEGYHCRWVSGFWKHGYWHPAHKVCWYR